MGGGAGDFGSPPYAASPPGRVARTVGHTAPVATPGPTVPPASVPAAPKTAMPKVAATPAATPDRPERGLSEEERERVLACLDLPTYEDCRDRALVAVFLATGLRFFEVLSLPLDALDRASGDLVVVGKGGRIRQARLSPRALKLVREYLRERPRSESERPWLTERRGPISYQGGMSIMRRLRRRCGVNRLHWHLFRHGFAQAALVKGAHPGMVQEMLGHTTGTMTRKYLGWAKPEEAARQMPQFSPI